MDRVVPVPSWGTARQQHVEATAAMARPIRGKFAVAVGQITTGVMLWLTAGACSDQPAAPVLNRAPQRIVSVALLADEILYDLGPEVRQATVAVSHLNDDKRYHTSAGRWPKTVVRTATRSEDLLLLRPDMLFVASFTAQELISAVRGAGIQVLRLGDMNGFADYRANIRLVATAIHKAEAGQALIRQFDQELTGWRQDRKTSDGQPSLRVLSNFEGMVPGRRTSFDDALTLCGGRNAATHRGFTRMSAETMIVLDPDLIVVPHHRTADPVIALTRAAKAGRLVGIHPAILTSSGRGMVQLTKILCSALAGRGP